MLVATRSAAQAVQEHHRTELRLESMAKAKGATAHCAPKESRRELWSPLKGLQLKQSLPIMECVLHTLHILAGECRTDDIPSPFPQIHDAQPEMPCLCRQVRV